MSGSLHLEYRRVAEESLRRSFANHEDSPHAFLRAVAELRARFSNISEQTASEIVWSAWPK